jgi:hypothetical protein
MSTSTPPTLSSDATKWRINENAASDSSNSKYVVMTPDSIDGHGDTPELPDVLQFMQLLRAVAHGFERASKRATDDLGVTGPQRFVLRHECPVARAVVPVDTIDQYSLHGALAT